MKWIDHTISESIINEEIYQLNSANIKYHKLGFISKKKSNISKQFIYYYLDDLYKN